ncbi:hypothetical protein [Novosphingobium sp. MD-1]|uniref:hypothetical protein n=1 Tax=Novosphingobium sp. MD-1 TaxID=1630648 RepID=UPI000F7E566E|nr:hypothetical protein [Novosphingobium sp. MD-1]
MDDEKPRWMLSRRLMRKLRTSKTSAFAAIAVLLIVGLVLLLVPMTSDLVRRRELPGSSTISQPVENTRLIGEVVHAGNRPLTLYYLDVPGGGRRALRLVDMRSGEVFRPFKDDQRILSGFTLLSEAEGADAEGYIAIARNGGTDERPLFDVVGCRFSDVKFFTLARGVVAMDAPQAVAGVGVSMVLAKPDGKSRFVIADWARGVISIERPLDLPAPLDAEGTRQAAPVHS